MACHLAGAKPLSEPMLAYCKLEPGTCQWNINQNATIFTNQTAFKNFVCKWQPFCLHFNVLSDEKRGQYPGNAEHDHNRVLKFVCIQFNNFDLFCYKWHGQNINLGNIHWKKLSVSDPAYFFEDLIQISFQQAVSPSPLRHDLGTNGWEFNVNCPLWREMLSNKSGDNFGTDPQDTSLGGIRTWQIDSELCLFSLNSCLSHSKCVPTKCQ